MPGARDQHRSFASCWSRARRTNGKNKPDGGGGDRSKPASGFHGIPPLAYATTR